MKSKMLGESISAEVTNVSGHGLWLLYGDTEYFLAYDDFPWFKKGTIAQVTHLQTFHDTHFYWPDLDVDLELEQIRFPERFPLVAKGS